jgi:hypothetical protein
MTRRHGATVTELRALENYPDWQLREWHDHRDTHPVVRTMIRNELKRRADQRKEQK